MWEREGEEVVGVGKVWDLSVWERDMGREGMVMMVFLCALWSVFGGVGLVWFGFWGHGITIEGLGDWLIG